MRCVVPVKRVIDYNVKIRIKADESGVETDHVKMSLNPFDEIALEEAQRLKEAGIVLDILAISIGPKACQETLRVALARGADRAIHIETENQNVILPLNVAKILAKLIKEEQGDLVLMGKQAIDDDCNQTGQMLAGLLQWPQGSFASKITLFPEKHYVEVTREVDRGLEVLRLNLPAVLTVDLRLNEPRYISLPNVMKAKSKPLKVVSLKDLGLALKAHQKICKVMAPLMRRSGIKVNSAKELFEKLKHEAKVL